MKKLYPLKVKNDFLFTPSSRDFIVEEVPLYPFSGVGEHLILHIRKKDITTWDMINIFAKYLGIKVKEIGYAGLKDKHAMTIQYISLLAKGNEEKLKSFTHNKIKILATYRHNNKIRIGHLKGNNFKIRLKKVLGIQRDKLNSTLKWIKKYGVPNYFGEQRFGTNGNNWQEGRDIVEGRLKMRNPKTKKFLISAYQSYLFNSWLSKRVEISLLLQDFSSDEVEKILNLPKGTLDGTKNQPHFFKLIEGDLMMHYPFGKVFEVDDLVAEGERFYQRDISPTGLLAGKRVSKAQNSAGVIESIYDKELKENGSRRYAWIFVEDIKSNYIEEKAHYELSFFLPKGSYATNVLDVLRGG